MTKRKIATIEKCEVEGCENEAQYALYETLDSGEKVWKHVCVECEIRIGNDNMSRKG